MIKLYHWTGIREGKNKGRRNKRYKILTMCVLMQLKIYEIKEKIPMWETTRETSKIIVGEFHTSLSEANKTAQPKINSIQGSESHYQTNL